AALPGEDDVPDDLVVWEHRHDHARVPERGRRVGGHAAVLRDEPFLPLRIGVAHDNLVARGHEVPRHRPAHHPQSNQSDWPDQPVTRTAAHHAASSSSSTSIAFRKPSTAAGMPQYTAAWISTSRIWSLLTPLAIAPRTCTRISCGFPSATSIAIVSMLRMLRGSWSSRPQTS